MKLRNLGCECTNIRNFVNDINAVTMKEVNLRVGSICTLCNWSGGSIGMLNKVVLETNSPDTMAFPVSPSATCSPDLLSADPLLAQKAV